MIFIGSVATVSLSFRHIVREVACLSLSLDREKCSCEQRQLNGQRRNDLVISKILKVNSFQSRRDFNAEVDRDTIGNRRLRRD